MTEGELDGFDKSTKVEQETIVSLAAGGTVKKTKEDVMAENRSVVLDVIRP